MGEDGAEETAEVTQGEIGDEIVAAEDAEVEAPQATATPTRKKKGHQWKKVDTKRFYLQLLEECPNAQQTKGKSKGKGKPHKNPDDGYTASDKGPGKGGGYGGSVEQAPARQEDDRFPLSGQGDGSGKFGGKGKKQGGSKGHGGLAGRGGKNMGGCCSPGSPSGGGGSSHGSKGLPASARMGPSSKGAMKGPPRGVMPVAACGWNAAPDSGLMQGSPVDGGGGCMGPGCCGGGGGGCVGMEPLDGLRGGPRPPGPQQRQLAVPGSPKGGMSQVGIGGPSFGVPCAAQQGMPGLPFFAPVSMCFVMAPPTNGPPAPGPVVPSSASMAPAELSPADHQAVMTQVRQQIEYYFGQENLVKDDYLRRQMNEDGWVPIAVIAGFPQVRKKTTDMAIILEAINASSVIEINSDGMHVRLVEQPRIWPLPNTGAVSMQVQGATTFSRG